MSFVERHVGRDAARRMDHQRVTIGLGACDIARREIAVRTGPVLDDDGLVEGWLHAFGIVAREHISAAAGRIGANDLDFARREILLRQSATQNEWRCGERCARRKNVAPRRVLASRHFITPCSDQPLGSIFAIFT